MTQIKKTLLFFIIFLIGFINIASSENNTNFEVTLPQITSGVEKIEYIINDEPKGSTTGKEKIILSKGTNLRFLVKFENEGYNENLLGNICFKSESCNLNLKFFSYTATHKIIEKDTTEYELIDPSQTYISEVCTINKNENFEIFGIEKDIFTARIDAKDLSDPSSLRIMYTDDKGKNNFAKYKVSTKEFIIENLNFNSILKLSVEIEPEYSNSNIKFTLNNKEINYNMLSKTWLIPIQNNLNLKILGIEKNKYNIKFKNNDLDFKYKKIGDENWITNTLNFDANYSESYEFTCQKLSEKEITINGNVILPNSNNIYFLDNIKENIEINIKNIGTSYYPIYFPEDSQLSFRSNSGQIQKTAQVRPGNSFTFSIIFSDAFSKENQSVLVYAVPENVILNSIYAQTPMPDLGSYLLKKDENRYTIENVTEPLKIITKNAIKKKIDITLPLKYQDISFNPIGDFDTSTNLFHVDYGSDFSFYVQAPEYIDTSSIKFLNDGHLIDIWNIGNVYTLKNVTSDFILLPESLPHIKHKLNFIGDNIIFRSTANNLILKNCSIEAGKSLEFTLNPKEGYKIKEDGLNVYTSDSNTIISKTGDIYKIDNITNDISITAEGTEIIMVTIKLKGNLDNAEEKSSPNTGINFISPSTGESLPSEITVPYGSEIHFETSSQNNANNQLLPSIQNEIIESNDDNVFSTYALTDTLIKPAATKALGVINCSLNRGYAYNWDMGIRSVSPIELEISGTNTIQGLSSLNLDREELLSKTKTLRLIISKGSTLLAPVEIDFGLIDNSKEAQYRVRTFSESIFNVIEYDFSYQTLRDCEIYGPYSGNNKTIVDQRILENINNISTITLRPQGIAYGNIPFIRTTGGTNNISSYLPGPKHDEKCLGWNGNGAPGFPFSGGLFNRLPRDFKFLLWPDPTPGQIGHTLQDEFSDFNVNFGKKTGFFDNVSYHNILHFASDGEARDSSANNRIGRYSFIRIDRDGLFQIKNKMNPEFQILWEHLPQISEYDINCVSNVKRGYWCKVEANRNQEGGDPHNGMSDKNFADMIKISHTSLDLYGSTSGSRQYYSTDESGVLRVKIDISDPLYELSNPKIECWECGKKNNTVTIVKEENTTNVYKISGIKNHAVIKISGIERIKRKVTLASGGEGIRLYSILNKDGIETNLENEAWVTDNGSGDFFSVASFGFTLKNANASCNPPEHITKGVHVIKADSNFVYDNAADLEANNYLPWPERTDNTKNLKWRIPNLIIPPNSTNTSTIITITDFLRRNFKTNLFATGAEFLRYGAPVTQQDIIYQEGMEFTIKEKQGYDISKATLVLVGHDEIEHILGNVEHTYVDPKQGDAKISFTGVMTSPNPELPSNYSGTRLKRKEGTIDTYVLENISEDVRIHLKGVEKLKYKLTLPTYMEGIDFFKCTDSGENPLSSEETVQTVPHGDPFVFKMQAKSGYSTDGMTVTANNIPIDLIDGVYTVKNITENIVIKISEAKKDTKHIKFYYKNGVTFKNTLDEDYSTVNTTPVPYGGDFKFKIILSEGYLNSDTIKVICTPNPINNTIGTTLPNTNPDGTEVPSEVILMPDDRGIYTLTGVEKDHSIRVEDIKLNEYKINFIKQKDNSGDYTFDFVDRYSEESLGDYVIKNYGENLNFSVKAQINSGINLDNISIYAKPPGLSEKIKLNNIDGVYTLNNITSDYTITVEDTQKIKYKVDFRLVEGISCIDTRGNELAQSIEVEHGESLSFILSKNEAYSDANPTVLIKNGSQIMPQNNVYTTPEIKNNIIIEILDVKKNTYKARFKIVEGVIYRTQRNKDINTVDPENSNYYYIEVEYDTSFNFKIILMDAYNESIPYVEMNNSRELLKLGDKYELNNLRSNTDINVKNVVKNPADITRENVDKLPVPSDVSTQSNIDDIVGISKAYENLSDDQKLMVSNITELRNAQKAVGKIIHKLGNISVEGVEWYAKLIAVPLNDDTEKIEYMNEKLQRKSIVSLYELKLLNILTNEYYKVPYGNVVSVSLPCPDLTGYRNVEVIHETSAGGIEILDVTILDNQASFETTSFGTLFGIAAKKVPNYVESSSSLTIALPENVSEEEVFKLLDENLISKLGDLTQDTTIIDDIIESSNKNQGPTNQTKWYIKIYNWTLKNEFLVVMIILGVGLVWVSAMIFRKKTAD